MFLAADQASAHPLRSRRACQRCQGADDLPRPRADGLARPFVLAVGSTMDITDWTFRYLGRDWNSSYGVSWSKGSTGSVTDSHFEHNFIGVYTNGSAGLLVQHNTFFSQLAVRHRPALRLDPHVDHRNNTSNYNGRHGIIFSDHVTAGIVRDNTTIDNGLNGIMMDEASPETSSTTTPSAATSPTAS